MTGGNMQAIIEWRRQEGLSLDKLAFEINKELEAIGTSVTKQTLNNWELGKTQPNTLAINWLSSHAHNEQVRRFANLVLDALLEA
jgi:transcriptional regulator with XRE-family HTH domain